MTKKRKALFFIFCIVLTGFLIPEHMCIPVSGATKSSWNNDSFWYYPWGKSGTHKGIDIFAKEGTDVIAATGGVVLYKGDLSRGGNVLVILGPKWRIHYYAHLKQFHTHFFDFVSEGEKIAAVGTTGNAKGKPPHLHYSFATIFPYLWRIDGDHQGWKKIFYLNPTQHFNR
ncbi:MAG TPA: M23 family metallopeptidase [Bacteroidia bacterium]|jgi:murein DD-endopeptidase MepM/ murein hydrolase activator NlpD